MHLNTTYARLINTRDYFKQSTLAGTVASNNAEHLTAFHLKGDIAERFKILIAHFAPLKKTGKEFPKRVWPLMNQPEPLCNVFNLYGNIAGRHSSEVKNEVVFVLSKNCISNEQGNERAHKRCNHVLYSRHLSIVDS